MFRNYLKTAWRNIVRGKGYTVLNISGLATGIGVALIIGLWVYYEYSYDKFLPDYGQLYQVARNFNSNGDTLTFQSTSLKLADALRTIPEFQNVAESDEMGPHGLMVGTKKFYYGGGQSEGHFLEMFQFPLLKGNAGSVLRDPYSIVLTQSTARALFGEDDPMGKTVRFDNKNDLKVTGILKDLPANSTFQFKFLVPFSFYEQRNPGVRSQRTTGGFDQNAYQIFVRLKPGVSYAQVAPKIKDLERTETTSTNAMNSSVILQPLSEWHLYSDYKNGKVAGGFIDYVRMFAIIGILVLMIACINFINLTTARSEKRAREVGVRKAIGSQRKDLVIQFLMESFLLTCMAFIFSLLLVQIALPFFNALTGDSVAIPYANPFFWMCILGALFMTAFAAGSRPAFYLSSFNPVKVLKGAMHQGKTASLPRKILVVVQFTCSVALIISTIIVYQQLQYARNRPNGYNMDRLMMTDMNDDLARNFTALKNELIQKGIVDYVTAASSPATNIYWHSDVPQWPGKNAGETIEMGTIIVSADYFKTLGMSIGEGRDYTGSADTTNVIFNEAAIERMRIKQPINQLITWSGQVFRIVGVAKNALMTSPFSPAEPTMFLYSTDPQSIVMYRLSPRITTADAIARLTEVFNKYDPAYPYIYEFADKSYAGKFNMEVLIGKLAGIFAALAIFISCLGLFGLAAYVAEQRTKEIGIRKVLGASIPQVWVMLSKDFIALVFISCVIASPIAFYFLQNWLLKYDYRITISPTVFVLAGAGALVITMITISFQAIKAALANPVKSLKSE